MTLTEPEIPEAFARDLQTRVATIASTLTSHTSEARAEAAGLVGDLAVMLADSSNVLAQALAQMALLTPGHRRLLNLAPSAEHVRLTASLLATLAQLVIDVSALMDTATNPEKGTD